MTLKLSCIVFLFSIILPTFGQQVRLLYDGNSPQASYAAEKLTHYLESQKVTVRTSGTNYDFLINLDLDQSNLDPESFRLYPEGKVVNVLGGDHRGMIYGTFSLMDQLKKGISLGQVEAISESPHFPLRAIKHNTPWYSYRPSSALDQHMETTKDIRYWEAFLDMMVEYRFNSFSLWNLHPFAYMIKPKNFPEASPFGEAEMEEWIDLHQEIFKMAHERALDTYLIPFNIFVSEEFAKAHGVAEGNYYPHYYVDGDTSAIVKRYTRESITQVLNEYPTLTGLGFTLGEGMAGMTPDQREKWMNETYIAGMRDAGRPLKLVHRIPFSSTTESLGATSVELEQLTRQSIEEEGELDFIEGPIWADLKYNWSHAHSTPKLVKVHGGEMFDTFYNPLPENYKITYTARNEDFFALRWGVPDFVRAHVRENSKEYVGGYFIGSESYIPAKDYFTALEGKKSWEFAFERQWLFYKLWGRLLYNPDTPEEVFEEDFQFRYGEKGKGLLEAFAKASATQLRLNSLYDTRWDFTLYGEGFLALIGDETRYISVEDMIHHPPLAPDYVGIKSFVEKIAKGENFGEDTMTPDRLADILEEDALAALELVVQVDPEEDLALFYEWEDVKIWANLGLHLAEKIRGGIALSRFRNGLDRESQDLAIQHLEKALSHWDTVVEISRPIYKDMHLTHYNAGSHDRNDDNLFHWALIRDEVAQDIEIAKESKLGEH
ncbi:glycoside hydrolase family 20 zincin-like fold domain-containing protein [Pleomorphovibrio marinus]|uniref:glycoside hydrolase family 20 zincin-like fold domain-containing protein n=1 Tax=Pleomorphovibrio marinus TaxID=2164132 RepID=UPI000E0C6384|nr:glycoside hydrolase family 20 zincin-like fold domain-containing protein [Pleomorphovibrio marinus]